MDCRQFNDRVDAFLDGDLSAADRASMEGHRQACAACSRALDGLQVAERALRVPDFHAAPPGMLAEFHRRLDAKSAPARRRIAWPWAAGTALAAAGAAALVLVFGVPDRRLLSPTSREPAERARMADSPTAPTPPHIAPAAPPVAPPPGTPAASPAPVDRPAEARDGLLAEGNRPHAFFSKARPLRREPARTPAAGRLPLDDGRRPGGGPARDDRARRDETLLGAARPLPAEEERVEAARPPADDLSPAILSALNRRVSVSITSEPATVALVKLGEVGDVAVSVDPRAAANRISLMADGIPLWQALEDVAEQSGLTIEPSGDGLKLAMQSPERQLRNQQLAQQRGRAAAQPLPRPGPPGAAGMPGGGPERAPQRAAPQRQNGARGGAVPAVADEEGVWAADLATLRARNFLVSDLDLADAAASQQPATGQAMAGGYSRPGLTPLAEAVPPLAAAPTPAPSEPPAPARPALPGQLAEGSRTPVRGVIQKPVPPATRRARPGDAAPALMGREERQGGSVWLVRSADATRFALVEPLSRSGDTLRCRLWAREGSQWRLVGQKTLRAGASLSLLGGELEWEAGTDALRCTRGSLGVAGASTRDLRELNPREARWQYR